MPGGKILAPSKDKANRTDKNWVLQYTTGYDILRVAKDSCYVCDDALF